MLLHMGCDLLLVGSFQGLDCFIVIFEFSQLLLEFLAPLLKSLLNLNHIILHFHGFFLILPLQMCFFLGHALLVDLELSLRLPSLLEVLLLKSLHLLF